MIFQIWLMIHINILCSFPRSHEHLVGIPTHYMHIRPLIDAANFLAPIGVISPSDLRNYVQIASDGSYWIPLQAHTIVAISDWLRHPKLYRLMADSTHKIWNWPKLVHVVGISHPRRAKHFILNIRLENNVLHIAAVYRFCIDHREVAAGVDAQYTMGSVGG